MCLGGWAEAAPLWLKANRASWASASAALVLGTAIGYAKDRQQQDFLQRFFKCADLPAARATGLPAAGAAEGRAALSAGFLL